MRKLRHCPSPGNPDLFDWAAHQPRHDMPATVRRIARRFRIAPATAATLADAFNIGGGQ